MRNYKTHIFCVCSILFIRILQVIRIWNHYAPPMQGLSLLSVNTVEIAGFLIAPLFIFLQFIRIKMIFHPNVLLRDGRMSKANSRYLKACIIDSLMFAFAVQLSGLGAAFITNVSFNSQQLFTYLFHTTALLIIHYILAGCVFILSSLYTDGLILPVMMTMLFLCWDAFAKYVTFFIQHDAYLGWRLIEGLLGQYAHQYFLSGLRALSIGIVVASMLFYAFEHASAEKIIDRFDSEKLH